MGIGNSIAFFGMEDLRCAMIAGVGGTTGAEGFCGCGLYGVGGWDGVVSLILDGRYGAFSISFPGLMRRAKCDLPSAFLSDSIFM